MNSGDCGLLGGEGEQQEQEQEQDGERHCNAGPRWEAQNCDIMKPQQCKVKSQNVTEM